MKMQDWKLKPGSENDKTLVFFCFFVLFGFLVMKEAELLVRRTYTGMK
jgi:hypothetical protein